jgi:hypothetical protein
MFCTPGHIFGGSKDVGSRFHVLRSPYSFSAVPRASAPDFIFCAPGLVFGGAEGVSSCFHVLRSRTRFGRYRGRLLPFSCFARTNSFSVVPTVSCPVFICSLLDPFLTVRTAAVPRASGPVFMFCAPGLIFGDTEGVGSHFHVLRARTHFRRYRRRLILFSCFALPDSFSVVPTALGLIFIFFAPGLVFVGSEGVVSSFHVLRPRIRFRRYRGRRVPFSSFVHPESFSAVSRASGPVFMFCAPEYIFSGAEGVWTRFLVLRSRK